MQRTLETPSDRVTLPLMFFFACSGPKIVASTTWTTRVTPAMSVERVFADSHTLLRPCYVRLAGVCRLELDILY